MDFNPYNPYYLAHFNPNRYPDGRFAPSGVGSTTGGGQPSALATRVAAGSGGSGGSGNPADQIAAERARLLQSTDPVELYRNRHLLSTNEIKERMNRIQEEEKLQAIAASYAKAHSPAARGKDFIDKALTFSNTAAEVYKLWNSDMGKAARRALGMKVPGKNDAFNALVEQYKTTSDADLEKVVKRMSNIRSIEQSLYGKGGKKD